MIGATPVVRGCGVRKKGACYAECGLSPFGQPVEAFLIDPPRPIPSGMAISPLGVSTMEREGVTHLIDWVGSEHYPNVADFIEEVRRFGMSRRVPSTFDFAALSEESRHLLVHARALIENAREWPDWSCPHHPAPLEEHDAARRLENCRPPMCAGLWWRDVREAVETEEPGILERIMPSFQYCVPPPEGVRPQYQPGFFASFPISRLVIVRGNDHEETWDRMQSACIPVAEVDE